ncbi:serine hydroxymethyltransferase [Bacteroidota bacterium]
MNLKHFKKIDSEIGKLIQKEEQRRKETIQLIAAENICKNEVLYPLSSILVSKTAEGVPGNRYHSGCSIIDKVETISQQRAELLFKCKKAWVQPLSGSIANISTLLSIFKSLNKKPEDIKILSMALNHGGHLSHGSSMHISHILCPNVKNYGVSKENGLIDYDSLKTLIVEFKPDIIITGASSYPRVIEFSTFFEHSKNINAIIVADISHIFGLVAAGLHNSPIPYCHFATASTYKAGGPKGGIILAGDLSTDEQCNNISNSIFPGTQSTPDFSSIASKAVFFKECLSVEFVNTQKQIIENSKIIANTLISLGVFVITNGTDNHLVLIDSKKSYGLTGKELSEKLEICGINVNKNLLPYDDEKPSVTSGIRIGTNTISRLGFVKDDIEKIAFLIDIIAKTNLNKLFIKETRNAIKKLMSKYSYEKFI